MLHLATLLLHLWHALPASQDRFCLPGPLRPDHCPGDRGAGGARAYCRQGPGRRQGGRAVRRHPGNAPFREEPFSLPPEPRSARARPFHHPGAGTVAAQRSCPGRPGRRRYQRRPACGSGALYPRHAGPHAKQRRRDPGQCGARSGQPYRHLGGTSVQSGTPFHERGPGRAPTHPAAVPGGGGHLPGAHRSAHRASGDASPAGHGAAHTGPGRWPADTLDGGQPGAGTGLPVRGLQPRAGRVGAAPAHPGALRETGLPGHPAFGGGP